mgnify:CR=1 FL=1
MDQEQLCALLFFTFFLLVHGLLWEAHGALFSVREEDLERVGEAGGQRAGRLRSLLLSPRETALSLLLAQRATLVGCAASGWWAWVALTGGRAPLAAVTGLSLLIVFMSSLISMRTFRGAPLLYAYRLSIPLWVLQGVLAPLRKALQRCTETLVSLLAMRSGTPEEEVLEREYLGLVELGRREGVLESEEHRLIHRVFEFGDRPVAKVMTPRVDVFSLPLGTELPEAVRRVRSSGFSRIPVYREVKDDVVGILYAKDLLRLRCTEGQVKPGFLSDILHPPFFVSTTMGIDELFKEFQRRKLHMAICVDEYGGISGLITMEDLLEEIFGEIYDEYDLETREWEPLGDGSYVVTGRMGLDALGSLLGEEIQEPECHTVAGLIMKHLGRLPQRGEEVERRGIRFVVEKISGTRVQAVRVHKVNKEQV